ncbi:MAG TPA: phage head closure protein [Clostridiaceae bacterium]
MNTGELFNRITLQKLTESESANGFPVETWTDYKTVWASANNLFGREFFQAAAVNAENTIRYIIRYLKDLDATKNTEGPNTTKLFRIKFNNSFYNITFIDDIKFEHKFMEVKALLVVV